MTLLHRRADVSETMSHYLIRDLDRAGVTLVASLVTELARDGAMVAVAAHTPELAALSSLRFSLDDIAAPHASEEQD